MIFEAKILRNTRKISISASHKKKLMDIVNHANGILFWLLFAFWFDVALYRLRGVEGIFSSSGNIATRRGWQTNP